MKPGRGQFPRLLHLILGSLLLHGAAVGLVLFLAWRPPAPSREAPYLTVEQIAMEKKREAPQAGTPPPHVSNEVEARAAKKKASSASQPVPADKPKFAAALRTHPHALKPVSISPPQRVAVPHPAPSGGRPVKADRFPPVAARKPQGPAQNHVAPHPGAGASLPGGAPEPSPTPETGTLPIRGTGGTEPKGGGTGGGPGVHSVGGGAIQAGNGGGGQGTGDSLRGGVGQGGAGQGGAGRGSGGRGGTGGGSGVSVATASSGGGGSSSRRGGYETLVKRLIEAHKEYPLAARRSRKEGSCERRFVLDRSGSINKVEALSSCGHPFLDEAATRAITAVRNFPPLPAEFGAEATFTVDIKFVLPRR